MASIRHFCQSGGGMKLLTEKSLSNYQTADILHLDYRSRDTSISGNFLYGSGGTRYSMDRVAPDIPPHISIWWVAPAYCQVFAPGI